ncbi:MAG: response regulator [Phycisphaerales bacterium]|nr:response regulator [Planctomycetota bacterium]MCH8509984.1 response regulator [Phycisphaerales bacterium]
MRRGSARAMQAVPRRVVTAIRRDGIGGIVVVLIVDSDPLVTECVGLLLRALKHRVVGARSVADAEAVLRAERVDLIVIEPRADGDRAMDLLRRIRTDGRLGVIPVLVLTSMDDKAQLLRVIELGVTQCMLKRDFSIRVFQERLGRLFRVRVQPLSDEPDRAPGGVTGAPSQQVTAANLGGFAPPAETRLPLPPMDEAIRRLGLLKPIIARSDLSDRLREVSELRALSPTVTNVLRVVSRPDSSIDSIVRAVRADHAIALKIVKIANSSAYVRGEPVCSVDKAVVRIGTESIKQAVTNIGIIEQFSTSSVIPGMSSSDFWEHAIGVAILAAEIARLTKAINPDEAFTIGLLHDIGRVLLAEAVPDEYARVYKTAAELSLPLEYVEKRMLLSSHADVAQDIFAYWDIPQNLIEPIVNHHQSLANIRLGSPKHTQAISVLALANRMAHAMSLGCSGNRAFYPGDEFFGAMSLGAGVMESLADRVPTMVEDLRYAMLSESFSAARTTPWRFPPCVYLTDDPCDIMRVFFRERAAGEEEFPPRVAVVRLRNPSFRVPMTTELLEREKKLGLDPLPLITLSPKGNLTILENHLGGRRHIKLTLPVTTDRLRAAVDQILLRADAADAA